MAVMLKDIKDLLVSPCNDNFHSSYINGYNTCRGNQGSRSIGLNREKLIDWICNTRSWTADRISDAIISHLPELLEVQDEDKVK